MKMSDYECPYCEQPYNADEHQFQEIGEVDCVNCKACGRTFEVTTRSTINYYTRKIKNDA